MLLAIFMALTIKFVAVFDRLRSGEARIEDIANRTLDIIEDDLSAAHIDSNFYQYECLSYWDHPSVAEESLGTFSTVVWAPDVPKGLQPDKSGVLLFFSKTLNRSGTQKEMFRRSDIVWLTSMQFHPKTTKAPLRHLICTG